MGISLAACGAPPPPKTVRVAPRALARATTAETPLPTLSPSHALIHIGHPRVALGKLTKHASNVDDDLVAAVITGLRIGRALDLEQPIDLVAADDAVLFRAALTAEAANLMREKGELDGHGVAHLDFPGRVCEARDRELLCATQAPALRFAPNARASALGAWTSDLHVVMAIPSETPKTEDAAVTHAVTESWRLLLSGTSEVALDVDVRDDGVRVSGTLGFTEAGIVARALLGSSAPAPAAALRRLPADAALVFMTTGATRQDLAGLRDSFVASVKERMVSEDAVSPSSADEISDAFTQLFFTGGPIVGAAGNDRPTLERARVLAPSNQTTRLAARRALKGYWIFGVEEDPERWIAGVKHLMEVDRRAHTTGRAPGNTKTPATSTSAKDSAWDTLTERLLPAPPGFPARTVYVEFVTVPKSPTNKELPYVAHVFVVPDGQRTWIVYAPDVDLARAKARALVDPKTPARPDVEPCIARKASVCVIATLAAAVPFMSTARPEEIEQSAADVERLFDEDTLTPSTFSVVPNGDRAELTATLPWSVVFGLARYVR